jgi:hypothetical protein
MKLKNFLKRNNYETAKFDCWNGCLNNSDICKNNWTNQNSLFCNPANGGLIGEKIKN